MNSLQAYIQGRPPRATYVLLALIGVCFGLELYWGATSNIPALVRMGALVHTEGFSEPWRLLSSTLLHGSVMHVALNGYVLYVIGVSVERLLGTWRFLLLYVLAGIGGSVLSTLLGDSVSVGASGAIWGLLAAMGVLAWLPRGVVPDAMVPGLRKSAVINLVINVGASFMPNVDWAGHAGGALVGAALMGSGLLTVGLPRLNTWHPAGGPPQDSVPAALPPLSVLLGLLLPASMGVALVVGKPGTIQGGERYEAQQVGEWQLELPPGLDLQPNTPGTMVFGDLLRDELLVEVAIAPLDKTVPASLLESTLHGLVVEMGAQVPADAQQMGESSLECAPLACIYEAHYELGNGLLLDRAVRLGTHRFDRVDVARRPDTDHWSRTARHVLDSLTPVSLP